MRLVAYDTLVTKYGRMTKDNHEQFKKQIKRLESIWRKDKDAFWIEVNGIKK